MGIGPPEGGQGRTRYIASSVCLYGCAPVVVVVVFMRPHLQVDYTDDRLLAS